MYNTDKAFEEAYKPYDVVTDKEGNVGFIQEVNINSCQESLRMQLSYAVNWLVGDNDKHAWFDHNELTSHTNLLLKIAESSCGSHTRSEIHCKKLLGFEKKEVKSNYKKPIIRKENFWLNFWNDFNKHSRI